MAQECGFFNAQLVGEEFDRVYLAEQFAAYFASFIGNGVFGKSMQKLQVLCQNVPNMSIKVLSGEAWINGWWYRNTDAYNIQVPIADGVLSRIDVVVLRWGNTERDMWLHLIVGTPSAKPVKPTIRRDADYYDLQLCEISVPAGAINIKQSQIKDTRLNNSVCGLVTGVVDQIDTTDLYIQFESSFIEWFEKIKGTLSEDAAGGLLVLIEELYAKHPKVQVANITHNMGKYVHCDLYETTYACGVQGAGDGPVGGGSLISSPVEYEMIDRNHIKVKAVSGLGTVSEVRQLDENNWAVLFKNKIKSLIITLSGGIGVGSGGNGSGSSGSDEPVEDEITEDKIDEIVDNAFS